MKPESVYYDHAWSNWLSSYPEVIINTSQISEMFAHSYVQVTAMSIAINVFKK